MTKNASMVIPGGIFGLSPQRPPILSITPLGGCGEIGMNCMVWGTHAGKVIIDCGLMFPSDYHLGIDVVIPRFDHIIEHKHEVKGIVLTHGHEDHIGALPWLLPHVNVPVYGSAFTLALVRHKLRERGLLDSCELVEVTPETRLELAGMTFNFFPVCHSIIDGLAFGVETPIGKVVHTGDFKIDPAPLDGPGTDLALFRRFAGEEGVTLLLSDSTNVEREGHSLTEREVLGSLKNIFATTEGRIIVTLFSSHIQRIQEVFDCARDSGRSIAVSGRSLVNNIEIARDLGKLRIPPGLYLDPALMPPLPDNEVVLLVTGSQGEPLSALSRITTGNHKLLSIHDGDVVIMSSRLIPGNTMAVNTLVNKLYRLGAEVYYDKEHPVHASGHGQRDELASMLNVVRPNYFIPIHGEYRHLVKHCRLARQCGVREENAVIVENGQPIILSDRGIFFDERIEAESILVDGKGVGDVGGVLLRERRLLGDEGMVVVVMAIDEVKWSLFREPEIFSKGFIFEEKYAGLLDEAGSLAKDAMTGLGPGDEDKLRDRVRTSLRRHFRKVLDRDPIIAPIVVSL